MSLTISNELLNFKNTVEPNLSSMNDTSTSLQGKISEIIVSNNYAKDGIGSVYYSQNKAEILGKFDQINDVYNKINVSLESDLASILSSSSDLVSKVIKLEELKALVDSAQNLLDTIGDPMEYKYENNQIINKNEVDSYNSGRQNKIDDAKETIDDNTSLFTTLHSEAETLYSKLKSMDSSLSFVAMFPVSSPLELTNTPLQNSSFEKHTFTASNGVKVDYYLYVPEFGSDVTRLPVHLYLHGGGEAGTGVLRQSLPRLIKEGMQPNGIVICPQSEDGTWYNERQQDALIELTNDVVKTYSADPKRISLSGHSNGAIGGYKLISRNPNYFSSFVPVSGHSGRVGSDEEKWKAISNVPIWAFHGTNDGSVKYDSVNITYNKLRQLGADNMKICTFEGKGHAIQNDVYSKTYSYDGKKYNPLDWAFAQTLSN